MNEIITLSKVNEAFMHIECSDSVREELYYHFSFKPPGYKFSPKYKRGLWSGDIFLFSKRNNTLYLGLYDKVCKFAESNNYKIRSDINNTKLNINIDRYLSSLNLPFSPRDYQINALLRAIENKRQVFLSPTASGKSLIIYMIYRFLSKRTLIIVPTISLVEQMAGDFGAYGYDINNIHKIYSGKNKTFSTDLVISTWQSIHNMSRDWFNQFEVVICDEVHTAAAKSISNIFENMTNVSYRYGFTGTIDERESKCNKMVIEGLMGPIYHVISTKELMDAGYIAQCTIKLINLKYPEETCKKHKFNEYSEEIDFLITRKRRFEFIIKLILTLNKNTLILFSRLIYGEMLYNALLQYSNKKIFLINGSTDIASREEVRNIVDNNDDCIVIASSGVFSTGVNIKNLYYILFSAPTKSWVKVLQSIGRGLRKSEEKNKLILFDIADNLCYKSKSNFAYNHYKERMRIYNMQKFKVEESEYELKL